MTIRPCWKPVVKPTTSGETRSSVALGRSAHSATVSQTDLECVISHNCNLGRRRREREGRVIILVAPDAPNVSSALKSWSSQSSFPVLNP